MNEESIFAAAIQRKSISERAAFLDGACGSDHELRKRVEGLLCSHEEAGTFLNEPAAPAATFDLPLAERPGTQIGPYKLLQQIGEGGMGVVYMAEQTEPMRRKVALKIIKPGMDTQQVIARFEAERQALSLMDHPNIARVFDAGTTDSGRPYFVMELVRGQPITQYCDERHLTPRQRLELLLPVCQAIQHAHQKGIIHRDIKPSNTLVAQYDEQAVPKVIDFGVAKATSQPLTERTMFTGFGQIVGTLEYMSPEQAKVNQLDIDTRSDIYSLGVLIYELLTGTTPFDKQRLRSAAWDEVLRMIREEEPPKPSARLSDSKDLLPSISALRQLDPGKLTKLVRGELDWIVMKAMEKDRERRYETANSLAADIQRYLADEPVQACPPSAVYRLRKFARRNRASILTVAAMVLLLVAGMLATSVGLIQAIHARQMAVDARNNEAHQRIAAELERTRAVMAEAEARNQAQRAAANELLAHASERQARKEALRAASARHALQIEEAFKAWGRHDVRDAERRLSEMEEPFQDTWEWRFLRDLCLRKAVPLTGHAGSISSTAFSSDGARLVTGSFDGTIRVWDTVSGRETRVMKGHTGRVLGVAISNDRRLIASGSALWDEQTQQYTSGELKVWDAQTGDELRTLPGHTAALFCVAFSPNNRLLASGSRDETVRVWDATTGELQLTLPKQKYEVTGVDFSPDGARIVAWSGGNVVVWDAGTGEERLRFRGGQTATGAVKFSPDGARLVAASGGSNPGIPGELRIFDATTGERTLTYAARDRWIRSVAFSPDGQRIAAGGGEFGQPSIVQVLDAATGRELYTLSGHGKAIYSVTFSPDGRQIVTGSQDRTARVWNPAVQPETLTLAGPQLPIRSIAFSADGSRLAAASIQQIDDRETGDVRVWETATGREILKLVGDKWRANSLAFSPDGQQIVTSGGSYNRPTAVNVWEAATGRELHCLRGFSNYVVSLALSTSGRRLAALGYHDTVKVWDATTLTEEITFHTTHIGPCTSLAINRDGSRLITGSTDGSVKIWKTATGREVLVLQAHTRGVSTLAISPNGLSIASGEGNPDGSFAGQPGELKVWNATNGDLEQTCRGHTEPVTAVTFSSDGRYLISGSRDGTVRLWDTATGQIKLILNGGSGSVVSVASSPNGLNIAAGNADGTTRLWRIPQIAASGSVSSP